MVRLTLDAQMTSCNDYLRYGSWFNNGSIFGINFCFFYCFQSGWKDLEVIKVIIYLDGNDCVNNIIFSPK